MWFTKILLATFTLINVIQIQEGSSEGSRYSRNILRKRAPEANTVDLTVDKEGRYTGGFNMDCSESHAIDTTLSPTFTIEPDEEIFQRPKAHCHWNVVGTENCVPVLNCDRFKLTPDSSKGTGEPCPEEHLEVSDGFKGIKRFCGGDGPKNLTTSNGLRDLYITFKGATELKTAGRRFKCTASCAVKGSGGTTVLENSFEAEMDEFCTCGRKPNNDRIVGGESAIKGEFPWIVALVTANTRKPYCGGAVINDRFILTAAHCFKGPYQNIQNFQVLINGRNLDLTTTEGTAAQDGGERKSLSEAEAKALQEKDVADQAVRFDVEKYFNHPLYVRQTNDYDLSLIKLKTKIDFKKYNYIQPICLPKIYVYNTTFANEEAVVAGWGLNAADAKNTMGTLQKLNLTVFPDKECRGFFDERMTPRMLCGGFREGGKDACKGDSGGPLINKKYAQTWQLIGAVSWGEGCAAKNSPGVYTRITEVNQWIRYISNMGDAVWCRGKET